MQLIADILATNKLHKPHPSTAYFRDGGEENYSIAAVSHSSISHPRMGNSQLHFMDVWLGVIASQAFQSTEKSWERKQEMHGTVRWNGALIVHAKLVSIADNTNKRQMRPRNFEAVREELSFTSLKSTNICCVICF